MGTAIKHPVPYWVMWSFVFFAKITNDGLTQSGTGCFIAVPICQQWDSRCQSVKQWRSRPEQRAPQSDDVTQWRHGDVTV